MKQETMKHKNNQRTSEFERADIPSQRLLPHQKLYITLAVAVLLLFSFVSLQKMHGGFGETLAGFAAQQYVSYRTQDDCKFNHPSGCTLSNNQWIPKGSSPPSRASANPSARPAPPAPPRNERPADRAKRLGDEYLAKLSTCGADTNCRNQAYNDAHKRCGADNRCKVLFVEQFRSVALGSASAQPSAPAAPLASAPASAQSSRTWRSSTGTTITVERVGNNVRITLQGGSTDRPSTITLAANDPQVNRLIAEINKDPAGSQTKPLEILAEMQPAQGTAPSRVTAPPPPADAPSPAAPASPQASSQTPVQQANDLAHAYADLAERCAPSDPFCQRSHYDAAKNACDTPQCETDFDRFLGRTIPPPIDLEALAQVRRQDYAAGLMEAEATLAAALGSAAQSSASSASAAVQAAAPAPQRPASLSAAPTPPAAAGASAVGQGAVYLEGRGWSYVARDERGASVLYTFDSQTNQWRPPQGLPTGAQRERIVQQLRVREQGTEIGRDMSLAVQNCRDENCVNRVVEQFRGTPCFNNPTCNAAFGETVQQSLPSDKLRQVYASFVPEEPTPAPADAAAPAVSPRIESPPEQKETPASAAAPRQNPFLNVPIGTLERIDQSGLTSEQRAQIAEAIAQQGGQLHQALAAAPVSASDAFPPGSAGGERQPAPPRLVTVPGVNAPPVVTPLNTQQAAQRATEISNYCRGQGIGATDCIQRAQTESDCQTNQNCMNTLSRLLAASEAAPTPAGPAPAPSAGPMPGAAPSQPSVEAPQAGAGIPAAGAPAAGAQPAPAAAPPVRQTYPVGTGGFSDENAAKQRCEQQHGAGNCNREQTPGGAVSFFSMAPPRVAPRLVTATTTTLPDCGRQADCTIASTLIGPTARRDRNNVPQAVMVNNIVHEPFFNAETSKWDYCAGEGCSTGPTPTHASIGGNTKIEVLGEPAAAPATPPPHGAGAQPPVGAPPTSPAPAQETTLQAREGPSHAAERLLGRDVTEDDLPNIEVEISPGTFKKASELTPDEAKTLKAGTKIRVKPASTAAPASPAASSAPSMPATSVIPGLVTVQPEQKSSPPTTIEQLKSQLNVNCKEGKCTVTVTDETGQSVEKEVTVSGNEIVMPDGVTYALHESGGLETRSGGIIQSFRDKTGKEHDFTGLGVKEVKIKDGTIDSLTIDLPRECHFAGLLCGGGETKATLQADGTFKLEDGGVMRLVKGGLAEVKNTDGSVSLIAPGTIGGIALTTIPATLSADKITTSADGNTITITRDDGTVQTIQKDGGGFEVTDKDADGKVSRTSSVTHSGVETRTFDHKKGTMERTVDGMRVGFGIGCTATGTCTEGALRDSRGQSCTHIAPGVDCSVAKPDGTPVLIEEFCKSAPNKQKCMDAVEGSVAQEATIQNIMNTLQSGVAMANDIKGFCNLVSPSSDCDHLLGDWLFSPEYFQNLKRDNPVLGALMTGDWEESACWSFMDMDRSNAEPGQEGFLYDIDGQMKLWVMAEKAPVRIPTEEGGLRDQQGFFYRINGEVSPSKLCKLENPPGDEATKSQRENYYKNKFITFSFQLRGRSGDSTIDPDKNPETPNYFRLRCDEGGISLVSQQTIVRYLAQDYSQICVKFHELGDLSDLIKGELNGGYFCNTILPSQPEISSGGKPSGGSAGAGIDGSGSVRPEITN